MMLRVFVMLLISASAEAGLLLEIGGGYITGNYTRKEGAVEDEGRASGPAGSAKVGWSASSVFVGAEYIYGYLDLVSTRNSTALKKTAVWQMGGGFAGVNINDWLRAWMAFMAASSLQERSDPASSADALYVGAISKIGVGVMVGPKMSLNFEYWMPSYSKRKNAIDGERDVALDYYWTQTAIFAGLSFPL